MINLTELRGLIAITRSHSIARRYFVTNGFDSSLAMLGLLTGFRAAERSSPDVALTACFGASVAIAISSVVSTYASESAELRRDLREITGAMLDEMDQSPHRQAARIMPIVIAAVSGLSPFLVAQLVMLPLWFEKFSVWLPLPPFDASVVVALAVMFLFGAFLGHVGEGSRLAAGLRLVAVGVVTALLIGLAAP